MARAKKEASKKAPGPARDRVATEQAIVDAAARLLAAKGYAALSVKTVAEAAGIDRKLVYRYFGGVEGVVERLGERADLWLGDVDASPPPGASYAATAKSLLTDYAQGLRKNMLLQRLLAWEVVEGGALMAKLDARRSAAVGARFAALRGAAKVPDDVDAPAINAILIAALHYLVLRENALGRFAGIDLKDAKSWPRIERALGALIAGVYGNK